MADLAVIENTLPESIEDLSKFVLIGRDKLQAVRAEISAIQKLGLAKEVYEQKKSEAQEIAETVTLAEMRTGELLRQIPKATKGTGSNQYSKKEAEKLTDEQFSKTKADIVKELGFERNQAQRMEQLAENPEIVREAIQEARDNDDIVSRAFVLEKIKQAKEEERKPHVSFNSGNNEWYTPKEFIDAARLVMGTIDLDPASSEIANETVQAEKIYTADDNGLACPWFGNVWLNPPYSSDLIGQFAEKVKAKEYNQAIVLVNNATETAWFADIVSVASAIVFPTSRVKFYKPDGSTGAPLQGQAILYVGDNPAAFLSEFEKFGWGVRHELHRRE